MPKNVLFGSDVETADQVLSVADEVTIERLIAASGINPRKFASYFSNSPELLRMTPGQFKSCLSIDGIEELKEEFAQSDIDDLSVSDLVKALLKADLSEISRDDYKNLRNALRHHA